MHNSVFSLFKCQPPGLSIRLLLTTCLSLQALSTSADTSIKRATDDWLSSGRAALAERLNTQTNRKPGAAKNVILFIGDGMSITTATAARILAGQKLGLKGEEHKLSFEHFPYTALAKTYNTNQQTPDSAGTMTAMVTGVKTKAGVLSLGPEVKRGQCAGSEPHQLPTLLEYAEQAGRSTGIVSTARITHATPAATYAKLSERGWENDALLPAAKRAEGCRDLARQLIEFSEGDGIDVVLGGGRANFLPAPEGRRRDQRHLIREWQTRFPQGRYVETRAQLLAATTGDTHSTAYANPNTNSSADKLLGLFNSSHMLFDAERSDKGANAQPQEPSLAEMTSSALKRLQRNPAGYFLTVEAGRIDHAHHANNAYHALEDTLALSAAVEVALQQVDLQDTLIIVTADHSHVFTMGGYPTRGNPILGYVRGNNLQGEPNPKLELAKDQQPYTTLGYYNGQPLRPQSSPLSKTATIAAKKSTDKATLPDSQSPLFRQQAAVPLHSETHAGEDVAVYATGAGSHLIRGVMEQHVIFHLIQYASGLGSPRQLSQ